VTHAVGVVPAAHPNSRDPAAPTFSPWLAECACGWKGEHRAKKREAVEDAAAHVRSMVGAAGEA
jgi:hypothetical protein